MRHFTILNINNQQYLSRCTLNVILNEQSHKMCHKTIKIKIGT